MSRRILILAERTETGIADGSYELIEAASRLAGHPDEVSAVLPVGDASEAEDLRAVLPAGELLLVEGPALAAPTADGYAAAVLHAREASGAECILLPHNPLGWDVAPLVAARLGTAALTAVSSLAWNGDGLVARRSAFLGKFLQEVVAPGLPAVATVEPGAYAAAETGPASSVRILPSPVGPEDLRSRLVEIQDSGGGGVDLAAADVVVAAGRGLGGPENLEIVRELAAALGGVVGASRAVTDAGWLPHELQIGSSGATVAPKLYVACAISGAIQHLVGMRGSRFVVAINKDPDAPVFGAADVGIVGDALEVIPLVTEAVRNNR
ncbi:MAG: electron transfer flavoprotein subunit alpha/FixB family protein [Acidobacteria bacterium]|nr:electron transfer flavoprotein subunit alpha/FixB family protein [Acidobacteriota bacterium]